MSNPTGTTSPPAARSLHDICEAARRGPCAYCSGQPGEPCAYSGTGPDGYHVGRFAAAFKAGLITGRELVAVLRGTGVFTVSTIVYEGGAR